jgi:hypothetical protein
MFCKEGGWPIRIGRAVVMGGTGLDDVQPLIAFSLLARCDGKYYLNDEDTAPGGTMGILRLETPKIRLPGWSG